VRIIESKSLVIKQWAIYLFASSKWSVFLFIFALLSLPYTGFSQKYSFTHYDIEDGLTQSQITQIAQDKSHHLLVSTHLGIGRFDGKTFSSITKDNGLPDNVVSAITTDSKGRIWGCSVHGLYYHADGQVQLNAAKGSALFAAARVLLTDNQDNIWGIKQQTLFKISNGNATEVHIAGEDDIVTSIAKSISGTVMAAVFNKGIFQFEKNKWVEVLHIGALKNKDFVKQIVDDRAGHLFILTNETILSAKNNVLTPIGLPAKIPFAINYLCADDQQGLWIAASEGAYYFNLATSELKYFNEANSFTSNTVTCIFNDADHNMWFGTNGSGLYRFNGHSYASFNQTQGFGDPNIMQAVNDPSGGLLMASSGFGLMHYDGEGLSLINIPSANPLTKKVFSLCRDKNDNIWIGTLYGGLWKKTGKTISLVYPRNKTDVPLSFNYIKQDQQNTIWIATNVGCYYLDRDLSLRKVLDGDCRSLQIIGRDTIVVGLLDRLALLKNGRPVPDFKADFIKGSSILCTYYYRGRLYVGTVEHGLFVWDMRTSKIIHLNTKNGLTSNSVYSMGIDSGQVLWLGTGKGINKFKTDEAGNFTKIVDETISGLVAESNQNSLTFFKGEVWIGTTRGLLVLNDRLIQPDVNPYTVIQGVNVFNSDKVNYTYRDGYKIPYNLRLPHTNSHITLSFKGINFRNPGSVSYSYKLTPLETRFSPRSKNDFVDYPSLPPGSYVFYVSSYGANGARSNTAGFSFEITPAYYQTLWFKVFVALLIILIIVLLWRYSKEREEIERKLIEDMRLEEQVKIRKQTAEDFHDDLGNKLTRISMLSEILGKRIGADLPQEKDLIDQIKENANALFTGSKHILWALDPDNDRLGEVLNHIVEFGIDIFSNTRVSFLPQVDISEFSSVTLPMGYGRNITLIFKELFNNILKHSGAEKAILLATVDADKNILFAIEDDGTGFDAGQIKSGNGIKNINNRAKRINGAIKITSAKGNGTRIALVLTGYKHLF
jgi:ligand-binding sensor domain-containing protein/signal transduction histidine kinase